MGHILSEFTAEVRRAREFNAEGLATRHFSAFQSTSFELFCQAIAPTKATTAYIDKPATSPSLTKF
jgi:hypothetical protein